MCKIRYKSVCVCDWSNEKCMQESKCEMCKSTGRTICVKAHAKYAASNNTVATT
jgi:hypothetical protein